MLLVASHILGGASFSTQLVAAAGQIPNLDLRLVTLAGDDYRTYASAVPWYGRLSTPLESSAVAAAKAGRISADEVDVLALQSFDLVPGFAHAIGRIPTIVFHDSTNVASYELERDTSRSRARHARFLIKRALYGAFYRKAGRVACFLPRTSWCADSLRRHFSIPADRIIVCPAGLDIDLWQSVPQRTLASRPTVLFVGNDLERKGVSILVECWRAELASRADLVIVSNDPAAAALRDVPGIRVVAGLKPGPELRGIFQQADLFAFPTRKDHMGLVLAEAAAAGLPLIASHVGGVGEIVRHGENGSLMPLEAGAGEWGKAIASLLDDPHRRQQMGESSRRLAETHLSQAALVEKLRHALAVAMRGTGAMAGDPVASP